MFGPTKSASNKHGKEHNCGNDKLGDQIQPVGFSLHGHYSKLATSSPFSNGRRSLLPAGVNSHSPLPHWANPSSASRWKDSGRTDSRRRLGPNGDDGDAEIVVG